MNNGGGMRHPVTGAVYELQPDGMVKVMQDGKEGLFDAEGRWLSGELEEADLHMIICTVRPPWRR